MKKLMLALCLLSSSALAQSQPNWKNGQVHSATEWNALWAGKQDTGGIFTDLSVSGTVSGSGFTNLFASPPPIGNVVPNRGSFTTLYSTGQWSQINPGVNFNLTSNNSGCGSGTQWWCSSTFAASSGTLTGTAYTASLNIADKVLSSGTVYGLAINQNVGANADSATGSRVGLTVNTDFRPAAGGSVSGTGINSGAVFNAISSRNLGGLATLYSGALNGANAVCQAHSGATFLEGCSGFETDTIWEAGSSYAYVTQNLIVGRHLVRGFLNDDTGIMLAAVSGSLPTIKTGLKFGDGASVNPLDPYARLILAGRTQSAVAPVASGFDVTNTIPNGCISRTPFASECTLQATNISGVTRLTTNGGTAVGYVYDAFVTAGGSGYTASPTVTLAASCGDAAVVGYPGLGGVLGKTGIPTPGTTVQPECSVASISTGTSGGIALVMSGNTLNFPINSTIRADCVINATTLTHGGTDAVGWSTTFRATMGATASTAAIVGAPSWTVDFGTTGAAAKFSGSAPATPAADTTLGGINLSLTPTSGSWDIGGKCTVTRSTRA